MSDSQTQVCGAKVGLRQVNTCWDRYCAGEVWAPGKLGWRPDATDLEGRVRQQGQRYEGGIHLSLMVYNEASRGLQELGGGRGGKEAMSLAFLPDSASPRYQNFSKGRWAFGRWGLSGVHGQVLRANSRFLLQEVDMGQMQSTCEQLLLALALPSQPACPCLELPCL